MPQTEHAVGNLKPGVQVVLIVNFTRVRLNHKNRVLLPDSQFPLTDKDHNSLRGRAGGYFLICNHFA